MLKKLAIFVLIVALATMDLAIEMELEKTRLIQREYEYMDAMELHYDADDWFVLIYKDTGLCGVYKACTPIMHKYLEEPPHEGLYEASELNLNLDVPEWTPVLVR